MKYVHHPDLTCLAQLMCFDAEHGQIERYTFPFSAQPTQIKQAVRRAVEAALDSRRRRHLTSGRIHVELDEDNPGSGRVVDHVPRGDGRIQVDGHKMVVPAGEVEAERIVVEPPVEEPVAVEPDPVPDTRVEIPASLTKEQVMAIMDNRGAVNKLPHKVGDTSYEPRSLKLLGTAMECENGIYRGVIRFDRVENDNKSPAIDFTRLPGMKMKRQLVEG